MQALTRSFTILIAFICLGFLTGLVFGHWLLGVAAGLFCHSLFSIIQLVRLHDWSKQPSKVAPQLIGVYEAIANQMQLQQRQNKREVRRLRAALAHQIDLISDVRDGVLLVNDNGLVAWFNHQCEVLLNLDKKQDIGLPLINLLRAPEFVRYYQSGNFDTSLRLNTPNDSEIWLEVSITVYDNGEHLLLLRDVTRVEKLETMRRDFIGNLSHELRTPLTVLRGYVETLQMQPSLTEPVMRMYSEMTRQAERMESLLRDLTMLSKLEAQDQQDQQSLVSLNSLILQAVTDAKSLNDSENHRISIVDFPSDIYVNGVQSQLFSVVSNLINNAVRHSGNGADIDVTCALSDFGVYIRVSDNGCGIDPEHLPRLTERFYRVEDSRNSKMGGTGLGLAIVKHSLNRHHGHLDISSTLGQGSVFTAHLPESIITISE